MADQYNSPHPIYSLRMYLVILAILSFLLSALAATDSGRGSAVWIFHILLTLCSAVLGVYDLVRYALAKARDPETKPVWPSKKILAGDAAAVFGWWYGIELTNLTGYYSAGPSASYASITALCYLYLHAVCFWKEFIAHEKAAWVKELNENGNSSLCHRCQQFHRESCSSMEHQNVDVDRAQTSPARKQSAQRIATPKLTSWLPSMLRRQQSTADDVEASAVSPSITTCLITPLADDDVSPGTSGEDETPHEQSIEHLDGLEVVVKKKVKKIGRKNVSDSGRV